MSNIHSVKGKIYMENFQSQLDRWLVIWQERLRLLDWDIKIKAVKAYKLGDENLGNTSWSLSKRKAVLQVLLPEHHEPSEDFPYDPEKTVIHELLHVCFAPFDNHKEDTLEGKTMEWAIEAISEALVSLDRE